MFGNGGNIADGMPWSFQYEGWPFTNENADCYLIPTLEGTHEFTPKDMLITGVNGEGAVAKGKAIAPFFFNNTAINALCM